MKCRRGVVNVMLASSLVLLLPLVARAQTALSGAIAGVATDTTGGVLPGVTVEVTSPALIGQTRTAVTDGRGAYRVVALPPGNYTITFSLPGFTGVRREGITLTTAFTAPVSVQLQPGGLQETVTVSAESPVVDVQNVIEGRILSRTVLDTAPIGKSVQALGMLIPAATVNPDVGGTTQGSSGFAVHGQGNSDVQFTQDGMSFDYGLRAGSNLAFGVNRAGIDEVSLQLGGIGAESENSGIQLNVVPQSGGNTFAASFATSYSNGDLQSDNITAAHRAAGLKAPPGLKLLYDYNFGVGGPIKRDKLWFYAANQWTKTESWAAVFYNLTPDAWTYTPDLSRQGTIPLTYQSNSGRVTWQASERNRLAFQYEHQDNCGCSNGLGATREPAASADHVYTPNELGFATWTFPATNKLLLEAGGGLYYFGINQERKAGVTDQIAVQELSTNFFYRARGDRGFNEGSTYSQKRFGTVNPRFSVSYITGTHNTKVGVQLKEQWNDHHHEYNGDALYRFLNGVPQSIQMWATPWDHKEKLTRLGIYAQDQWTLWQLTLNLGVRYDWQHARIPAQHAPAGTWVGERDFEAVDNVPNWKDISPRLGVAYDLFGNGRTAVKVSAGRYVKGEGTGSVTNANNPMNRTANNATRTWTDANGDFIPQERELGPISNRNFGQLTVSDTVFADDVLVGWGVREYNWSTTASIEHQLRSGLGVKLAYFRTSWLNRLAEDNVLTTFADYDPFCITAPVDARLPGGGGNQICGLYDITPALFGRVRNIVSGTDNFGKATEVFNGIDVTIEGRFGQGAILSGGVATGANVTDDCEVGPRFSNSAAGFTLALADSPERQFCKVSPPWSANTNIKIFGAYVLPWDTQVSALVQNLPGPQITATYVAPGAVILPGLGRNLAAGARATKTIELIEPGTQYGSRWTQVDLRVSKGIVAGPARVQGIVELYNLFNASPVLGYNTRYGSSWLNVTSILPGRMLKFGAQVNF